MPHERYRSLIGSIVITFSGLTIADFNAYLGCLSLILGIGYQIWKWHRAWVKSKADKAE
jgi:hypothetical protein